MCTWNREGGGGSGSGWKPGNVDSLLALSLLEGGSHGEWLTGSRRGRLQTGLCVYVLEGAPMCAETCEGIVSMNIP